jgi:hypothetical protein
VGIGGTFDKAVLLSKKALLIEDSKNPELTSLEKEITDYINQNAPDDQIRRWFTTKYITGEGKRLQGLVNRRNAEAKLYFL